MDKVFKITIDVIFVIVMVILGVYFLLRIIGICQIYKVKTGSMEDGIHPGDYILVHKKDIYNVGDIVTYKKDDYHVTHRIIKKHGNKVITKGDANNMEDEEIQVSTIIGEVIYIGGLLNLIINFKYLIASVLLGLYLLTCFISKDKEELKEE